MFCSLGTYERFKALTILVLYILAVGNMKLHNISTHTATAKGSQTPPGSAGVMPSFYTLRLVGFVLVFFSYAMEISSAIPRMRLVE